MWGVTATFDCLTIDSGNNIVKGLAIGRCSNGVAIASGGQSNAIGGSGPGEGNWMYNNNGAGVLIGGGSGNSVKGNLIGTNRDGTGPGPNGTGVVIALAAAQNNAIGGGSAGERNVISGNSAGVVILDGSGNTVQGNYIGTNAAGTGAIPNETGVSIGRYAFNNTIGGGTAAQRNVISGKVSRA